MKKQIVLWLILGSLFTGVTGCSAFEESIKDAIAENVEDKDSEDDEEEDSENDNDKDSEDDDEEDSENDDNKDSEDDDEHEEEDNSNKKTKKESKKSSSPVLGDEALDSYDGFEYLIADLLITDSEENKTTGKMERKQMQVFIPKDDYISVSGNRANAEALGLSFKIELEPYIRYDEEDYLLSENLEYLIQADHDPFYTDNDKDVVISDIQELSENSCSATVEYCKYNSYDDTYYTIFETYYLCELEDEKTVSLKVSINADQTTGKTPMLIEELESFYQFEIDWDKERAVQKLEAFLANGGDNTVSTGYFMFTLPDGWKKDTKQSSYDSIVCAPGGNYKQANCMISFTNNYLGYDEDYNEYDVSIFTSKEESTKELLEKTLEVSITDFSVELCDTAMGEAAKITYEFSENSVHCQGVTYFIIDGGYLYLAEAIKLADSEEDSFAILEDILANGQLNK